MTCVLLLFEIQWSTFHLIKQRVSRYLWWKYIDPALLKSINHTPHSLHSTKHRVEWSNIFYRLRSTEGRRQCSPFSSSYDLQYGGHVLSPTSCILPTKAYVPWPTSNSLQSTAMDDLQKKESSITVLRNHAWDTQYHGPLPTDPGLNPPAPSMKHSVYILQTGRSTLFLPFLLAQLPSCLIDPVLSAAGVI